jgi:hypothetical protein
VEAALRHPTEAVWRDIAGRAIEMLDECREALVVIRDRAPPEIRELAARALPGGC